MKLISRQLRSADIFLSMVEGKLKTHDAELNRLVTEIEAIRAAKQNKKRRKVEVS